MHSASGATNYPAAPMGHSVDKLATCSQHSSGRARHSRTALRSLVSARQGIGTVVLTKTVSPAVTSMMTSNDQSPGCGNVTKPL